MVDLDVVGPAVLSALERPFVLRPQAARVHGEELVLVGTFVRHEVVRLVLHDRTAGRPTVLIAPVVGLRRLKEFFRRDRGVAEEHQPRAVQLIGARLGDDRQHAAGRQSVLGFVRRGRDLELLDRVHREVLARLAHLGPRVVDAVDDEAVRILAGAGAEVDVAAIEEAADVVLRGAGRQHREIDPAPRRHRQVLNLPRRDRGGDVRAADVDDRRLAGDGDGLGDGGRPQREVDRRGLVDDEDDIRTGLGAEAAQLRSDGVAAGRQRRQAVLALAVGHADAREAGVDTARRDGDAGDHGAARVLDATGHLRVLREGGCRARGEHRGGEPSSDPFRYQGMHHLPPAPADVSRAGELVLPGMTGRIRTVVSDTASRVASSSMRCREY